MYIKKREEEPSACGNSASRKETWRRSAAQPLPCSSQVSVGAGGAVALLAHFLNQLLFLSLHTQKNVVAKLR